MTQNNQEKAKVKLVYSEEVKTATAELYEKLRNLISEEEWATYAPYIFEIQKLKKTRNAIILAHNYQRPEVFHGVADLVGDSLGLARDGAKTDADVIVVCGVHFMAETAKLLSPEKTVLIPDAQAGCSLADSITAEDVRGLRKKYPDVPIVTYVNTSAAVKAECDICCTSSNAVKIVESLKKDRVLCIPDQHLASYVATQSNVEILKWQGSCEVHEQFTNQELRDYKTKYPHIIIAAHPECPQNILKEADYVGSTGGMLKYVEEHQPTQIAMITECSMSDNLSVDNPNVQFLRPCNFCPHMQLITLEKIYYALLNMTGQVEVDPQIAERAKLAVQNMLQAS